MGSMHHLAENKHWRTSFQDQLGIAYCDHLYAHVLDDVLKHEMAAEFIENTLTDQFITICDKKDYIMEEMENKQLATRSKRAIESENDRQVHLIFNPNQPIQMTPFTKKFMRYLDGTLVEKEAQEAEQFDIYLEKLQEEQLEEGETNPIKYSRNPLWELELHNLEDLSFSVADNPFVKTDTAKYIPEVYFIGEEGEILHKFGPDSRSSEDYPSHVNCYVDNFRDDKMKINDDRKVKFGLKLTQGNLFAGLPHSNNMILLTVRVQETKKADAKKYNEAWFRLNNESTNQTIDYTKINDIEMPGGFDTIDEEEPEEGEDGKKSKGELIYIAGRIY